MNAALEAEVAATKAKRVMGNVVMEFMLRAQLTSPFKGHQSISLFQTIKRAPLVEVPVCRNIC
jgi:hypothetical protein